ncbi:MAG: NAD-dependent epimerase/dehydratase family protein [Candidatus Micrarchaeota archaeon]|nr:NAD-dependent epimerase/dehydratase family protein [Candidatus Micrarchaeota archaeon]
MKELILVTGATGRLGRALVKKLLAEGHGLRLVARDKRACAHAFGGRCETVQLDLENARASELAAACRGCPQVIHLAALLEGSEKELMQANWWATKKLVTAARKAGVKRFIYCSTTSVYGNPRGTVAENSPKKPVAAYGKSKLLAEAAVMRGGVPWIILRPAVIYGPGFSAGFKALAKAASKGILPVIGSGRNRVAFVHADDVIGAFLAVLAKPGVKNEDFNISGHSVTQAKCMELLAKALGARPLRVRVPRRAAYALAKTAEFVSRARGRNTAWTEYVRAVAEDRAFPAAKAGKMLGWRPRMVFEKEAPQAVRTWMKK